MAEPKYSFKALNVFKTLYENQNATKTASTLGITQSGVSRSLAQLEKNTGLLLFVRQNNRLIATPEANELYKEVSRLLFNFDEIEHSVAALREFGASRVRIATIPGLAYGFVPNIISGLLKHQKKLDVYFDVLPTKDIVHGVEMDQFDLGFVTLPVDSQNIQLDVLEKTKAVCLLPKEHPLTKKTKINLSDLSNQHLVIPNQPNMAADKLLKLINKNNISISGKTEANISSICALVGNGVGISIINPITANDLKQENTVTKPFSPAIHYSFGLIYKKNWQENRLIKLIRNDLKP